MFFNIRKRKRQHRIVKFSDVDSIVMKTGEMHFELLLGDHVVKYRNVITPRDGGMSFPDGYFDEYKSHIPNNIMKQISTAADRLFANQTPEDHLDYLPDGATRDAYMRVSSLGKEVYYTNTYAIKDGSEVKLEPVAKEFMQIVRLLKPLCPFPESFPMGFR